MNGARALLDTNVLVYLYGDSAEPTRSKQRLPKITYSGHLVQNTQRLGEWITAASLKFRVP